MATYKAAWTVGVNLRTAAALADTASLEDTIDNDTVTEAYLCGIEDKVTIAAGSPSGNVTIEYFLSWSGTSNFDTKPVATQILTFTATGTQQASMGGFVAPFVKRKITNTTGAAATLTSNYGYLKQESV